MKQKVGNGGIAFFVGIIVGNIFGDGISQLHEVAADQAHDAEGGGHDLGD